MKDYQRPLRITHCYFGYAESDSYEDKVKKIEARILDLKAKGFGGIVTNVGDAEYLHNETEWKLMREKVRICRENDLRMWLYDEKGYPSGGAWKETLSKNRDFEARAVVAVCTRIAPGEEKVLELPYGHEKTLNVFVYRTEKPYLDDEALSQGRCLGNGDRIVLKNEESSELLAVGFYQKHMYEGAHCQNNVCARRRYIDVSNKDAVGEFLDNTYRRYAEALEGSFAACLGDPGENAVVEAIFTDEPSFMGHYINHGIHTPCTDDEPDEKIVLYPVINWGRDFANRYASLYGSRLEDLLPYLFFGCSEKARTLRKNYRSVMSDLYEEAFFAQISDYCAKRGMNFSGHILLEDELKLHPIFEGNFFRLLRHMHIPGIDMLHGIPSCVWDNAFTPLLVRSIACLNGRDHVMDEISAHAQGGNVTADQMKCAIALQFALGADVFTSYFDDNRLPAEEQKKIFDGIARAERAVGTRSPGKILLYYPIETAMALTKPTAEFSDPGDPEAGLLDACQNAMNGAMYTLLNSQIPFCFCDTQSMTAERAEQAEVLVLPEGFLWPELEEKLLRLVKKNKKIIWYRPSGLYSEEEKSLPDGIDFADGPETLLAKLPDDLIPTEKAAPGVAALWGSDALLLVNSTEEERTVFLKNPQCFSFAVDIFEEPGIEDSASAEESTGEKLPLPCADPGKGIHLKPLQALLLK